MTLQKVVYSELNARQKENFNFQKLSAVLADYGFTTVRLSDDWKGADMLAIHIDGKTDLRIQLKGRLCVYEKYRGKDLWIGFPDSENREKWYLYPHDAMVGILEDRIGETSSWKIEGGYSFPGIPAELKATLDVYAISGTTRGVPS